MTVRNAGTVPVRGVRVEVVGDALDVGTLAPGQTWTGRVLPGSGPARVAWATDAGRFVDEHLGDSDTFWRGVMIDHDADSASWR